MLATGRRITRAIVRCQPSPLREKNGRRARRFQLLQVAVQEDEHDGKQQQPGQYRHRRDDGDRERDGADHHHREERQDRHRQRERDPRERDRPAGGLQRALERGLERRLA